MDDNDVIKQWALLIENQTAFTTAITTRLSAMQDYLASRDPQFWDEWPKYLEAAEKKVSEQPAWLKTPEDGKVH